MNDNNGMYEERWIVRNWNAVSNKMNKPSVDG